MIHLLQWIEVGVMIVLSGMMKALADTIQHSPEYRTDGWKKKWATFENGQPIPNTSNKRPWYYLWLYSPRFKERFPLSSTALVFLTDEWHLVNFFQYRCVDASIGCLTGSVMGILICMVALPVMRGIGFWSVYRK